MSLESPQDQIARAKSRKALLAGGLVLGLGTAVTLAAWSDDAWVSASFNTGSISIEGSVDSFVVPVNWQPYATAEDSAPLSFTLSPSAMKPGDTVRAPLSLRLASGSSGGAAISIPEGGAPPVPDAATASAADIAFFNSLEVTFYRGLTPNLCVPGLLGALATPLSGYNGVPMDTDATSTLFSLTSALDVYSLCIEVHFPVNAPPSTTNGKTGPLTWNFLATATG